MRSGLNGDSAWLLYVARQVHGGARLYADVVEVNPPLVVWLNLPIIALARVTGWPEAAVYQAFVWALALLSLWLSSRVLRALAPSAPVWWSRTLVLAVAVVLVGMPGPFFGQREHLALILVVPWLLTSAARLNGVPLPTSGAVVVGVLAAVGICLKPHFLLLPAAIAAYVYTCSRAPRRVWPEQAALGGAVLGYGVLVLAVAPGYLALVSRWGPVYWDYLRRPMGMILWGDLLPLSVIAPLLYWPVARRLAAHPRLADVLGLATVTFFAAVVLQHKGFGYHYYPPIGTGLLLVVVGVLGKGGRPATPLKVAGAGLGSLVLLPILALFVGVAISRAVGDTGRGPLAGGSREVGAFLDAQRPGGAVVIYSPWMDDSFPLMLERQVRWGSRYPFIWFLTALYRDRLTRPGIVPCHRESEISVDERELIGTVAADLRQYAPDLVFVRKPGPTELLQVPLLACFSQTEAFRREFRAYRPLVDLEYFRVYQRTRT